MQRDVQERSNEAFDLKDDVESVKKKMGECEIPVNISQRVNEMQLLNERMQRIADEFYDLKKSDEDFRGELAAEETIQEAIRKFSDVLKGFDQERQDLQKFLTGTLQQYKHKDFVGLKNCHIIIEVREYRFKLIDMNERLRELEDLLSNLNT